MIAPDDTGIATLAAQLAKTVYDCVVVGDCRRPPRPSLGAGKPSGVTSQFMDGHSAPVLPSR
ncbi:MAG TPA: hypothetical protein VLA85_18550 [Verrucomicrobiae bacterium]|nr:hypothetical protein [Verrucomicrobiae bacterium]